MPRIPIHQEELRLFGSRRVSVLICWVQSDPFSLRDHSYKFCHHMKFIFSHILKDNIVKFLIIR